MSKQFAELFPSRNLRKLVTLAGMKTRDESPGLAAPGHQGPGSLPLAGDHRPRQGNDTDQCVRRSAPRRSRSPRGSRGGRRRSRRAGARRRSERSEGRGVRNGGDGRRPASRRARTGSDWRRRNQKPRRPAADATDRSGSQGGIAQEKRFRRQSAVGGRQSRAPAITDSARVMKRTGQRHGARQLSGISRLRVARGAQRSLIQRPPRDTIVIEASTAGNAGQPFDVENPLSRDPPPLRNRLCS